MELLIITLYILSLCCLADIYMKSISRKINESNIIIEALRCLLSISLAERFQDEVKDKKLLEAKYAYVRSTINLLDHFNNTSNKQVSGQVKETSKKGDK